MVEFSVLDLLDEHQKEHNHLQLRCIAGHSGLARKITSAKISRPGLPLSGFFEEFSHESLQLFGRGEQTFLKQLEQEGKHSSIEKLFSYAIPACIFCEDGTPSSTFIAAAETAECAILVTPLDSGTFSRSLFQLLDEVFAKTATIHGVLVEVFGVGVLIMGDSGVGKSETALELIERGHRLISDDAVKLRNIADTYLIGSGENSFLAHHMEIRGLGIINLAALFGVGAIRAKKEVQLIVRLENWDSTKSYDRIGEEKSEPLLGISIPLLEIPVKPGRNIPIIIETAARNERLKNLGYNSAKEFDQSVLKWLEREATKNLSYNDRETI